MFFKISEALFGVPEKGNGHSSGDVRTADGRPVKFNTRVFDALFGGGTPSNMRKLN